MKRGTRAALLIALASVSLQLQAKDGRDPMAFCRADFERHCKSVEPGDGRIIKCMIEKKSSLSAPCAELISKKQAQEQQVKKNKDKVKS